MRFYKIFVVIFLLLSSCIFHRNAVPFWLHKKPVESENVFYEIGSCGKTLNPKDAEYVAFIDAITRLSIRMKVRIKSIGIDILTEECERFDREKFLNISQEVTDLILYGAEIKSVYYDEKGRCGPPGYTYVLVEWSESNLKERIDKLKEKYKEEIEKIKEQ